MTSLSIVIVSYRCWKRLDKCLQSIYCQKLDFLEIIVVDNFSNDGELAAFEKSHPQVQFIAQNDNGGFAQACNKGASNAKGNCLLFLNPDTILATASLQNLLEKVQTEPSWKLIGIKQLDDQGKDTYPFGLFLKWWNIWPPIRSLERILKGKAQSKKNLSNTAISFPDWISGSFLLIRKEDFIYIGGWDERFWMYCEDMDLSKRAYTLGWKRVMYNNIQCIHSHGGSSRSNATVKAVTKSAVIISTLKYIQKHFTQPFKSIAIATKIFIVAIELLLQAPISKTKRLMLVLLWKALLKI